MFENEGTEIESTSDVSPESSPETQTDAQPEQQAAAPQQVKEVPFHEHPRWKEVMEERNAERQQRAQLEQKLAQMERQFRQSQQPKDTRPDFNEVRTKMAERLKGIDPEFQSYMSLLEEQALSSKQELARYREEQFVERAVGKFEELNKANNVPAELAPVLRAQLDEMYRQGKIRNLGDLENAYKQVHAPLNKLLEERERSALAKYTTEKKAVAAKPAAQPKGRATAPGSAQKSHSNAKDRRSSIIADVLAQTRASKEV